MSDHDESGVALGDAPEAGGSSQSPAPQDDVTPPAGVSFQSQASKDNASVSSITFHDLGYDVTQRKCFKKLPNKTILDSVRSIFIISYGRVL